MVFQLNRRRLLGLGAAAVSCMAVDNAFAATRLPLLRPDRQAAASQPRPHERARTRPHQYAYG